MRERLADRLLKRDRCATERGSRKIPQQLSDDDDDDDFGWNDDDWDADKHERAADYHRAVAQQSNVDGNCECAFQSSRSALRRSATLSRPQLQLCGEGGKQESSAPGELPVVDFSLKVVTEKQCEAAQALAEHLDCKDDQRGLRMLDELLEYTTMLVRLLNDWQREHNGSTK